MTQKCGFFNSEEGDVRTYQDVDFARMMSLLVGRSGYVPNYLNELEVVEGDSSLTVKVSSGAAWLGTESGWWYINDSNNELDAFIDPGTGETVDYRIVLELDREFDRNISIDAVDYSEDLGGDINTYRISLAKVTIDWSGPSFTITDERVPCVASTSGIAEKNEAWTLSFSDINKFVKCTNTSAINVTVPLNATSALPINTEVVICQYTGNTVTVAAQSGVVVRALDGLNISDGQYSAFTLRKIGTDEWIAIGALTS